MPSDTLHPAPVLAPTGDLDLTTSRALAAKLAELSGEPSDAVLDLSGVGFMDSIGLGVVLKGVQRFSRQDKALILVVPEESNVRRLLELAGADRRVATETTREAALARANAPR